MATRYYTALLERVPGGFSVSFPDLDGCVSHGITTEDAARQAEQALALHLRGMIEDGDAIPEPTPLEQVERDPEVEELARILVRAELPGRAVRVNITMEEGLLAAVDATAQQQGKEPLGVPCGRCVGSYSGSAGSMTEEEKASLLFRRRPGPTQAELEQQILELLKASKEDDSPRPLEPGEKARRQAWFREAYGQD
ncbi:type II toxin-antitoxin system HicB family antitoxin [Roseomonas sp. WA12]